MWTYTRIIFSISSLPQDDRRRNSSGLPSDNFAEHHYKLIELSCFLHFDLFKVFVGIHAYIAREQNISDISPESETILIKRAIPAEPEHCAGNSHSYGDRLLVFKLSH